MGSSQRIINQKIDGNKIGTLGLFEKQDHGIQLRGIAYFPKGFCVGTH